MTTATKPALSTLLEDPNFIQTVKNLAYGFYSKYGYNPMISMEDLENEGMLAASVAYNSFNLAYECTFKTHAYQYMRHAMNTYCRKFCHVLSISEKDTRNHLDEMLGVGILRIDQKQDSETDEFDIPVGSGVESYYDIDEFFFTGFSLFERSLATDHLINDMSLQQLSRKYGVSKSRVGSIINGLKARMRTRIEQDGEKD